jgi:hypothetical protein
MGNKRFLSKKRKEKMHLSFESLEKGYHGLIIKIEFMFIYTTYFEKPYEEKMSHSPSSFWTINMGRTYDRKGGGLQMGLEGEGERISNIPLGAEDQCGCGCFVGGV